MDELTHDPESWGRYFADYWNWLDCTNYALAIIVIVVEIQARRDLHDAVATVNSLQVVLSSSQDDTGSGAGDLISNAGINSALELTRGSYGVEVDRPAFFSSFVCFYGVGYRSELAYSLMGVNAVITWLKLLK